MMKREKKQEFIKNLDGAIDFEIKEIKSLKPWNRSQNEGIDDQRVENNTDDEMSSSDDENERRQNYLFSDEEDLAVPVVRKRKESGMEVEGEMQPNKRAKEFEQQVDNLFNPKKVHFQSHFIEDQEPGSKVKRDTSLLRKQEGKEVG